MGKKKSGSNVGRQATTSSSSAAVDKTPRVRKPAMERSQALIRLAVAKLAALAKMGPLVSAGETPIVAQSEACERIVINLHSAQNMATQVANDVNLLVTSGFVAKAGSAGRKGLAEGDLVKIKEAKFDKAMHGDDNDFEVVKTSEKYVLIRRSVRAGRGVVDDTLQFPVLRAWIEVTKVS